MNRCSCGNVWSAEFGTWCRICRAQLTKPPESIDVSRGKQAVLPLDGDVIGEEKRQRARDIEACETLLDRADRGELSEALRPYIADTRRQYEALTGKPWSAA